MKGAEKNSSRFPPWWNLSS
ncbi:hypothetical protein ACSQ67_003880 [Phaseolus vulgaris]